MKKLLTISVAAYHVEKYLGECLDSFTSPEFAESLEVLVINDGAGEEINAIAREYEKKYPSVFRLIDKENGGHGSTVNRGIEEASGLYFKTVDGDDRVRPEGLAELIQFLHSTEVDLVVTDYQCFDDRSGAVVEENRNEFPGKKYRQVYSFDDISHGIYINMHAAAFRTSLLRQMKRRLTEHCFYVDAEYILYPVPQIESIVFLEKPVYQYRQGMTSQSMDIRNMQKNCGHHERVLEELLAFYRECQGAVSPEKAAYVAKGIARILVSQIKIYLSFPAAKEYRERIQNLEERIKRDYPVVYDSVANTAVKLLRISRYRFYRVASAACRRAYGCRKGEKA